MYLNVIINFFFFFRQGREYTSKTLLNFILKNTCRWKVHLKLKIKNLKNKKIKKLENTMYFSRLYYAGIFPFLTNKKEIKPRSNIFKIDSVVSTKLSPDSSFIELLGRESPFVVIDDNPVFSLCLISTTSTLLDKFGILQYLSNNSSNELLMI